MNRAQVDLGNLPTWAANIADRLRVNGFAQELERQRQVICLAEEVGELLGAWRRHEGWGRRTGPFSAVEEEMADVIITAHVTAHVLGIDIENAISAKLDVIFTRGWHEVAGRTTE